MWIIQKPPIKLTGLLCMTVCFCMWWVGGLYYMWHIHAGKWSCALLTHRLKRLIDCGSVLTLERRQPVPLTFSFTLWSFFFFFFFWGSEAGDVGSDTRVTGAERHLASPTARRAQNIPAACDALRVPQLFKLILARSDKWLKITKRYLFLE